MKLGLLTDIHEHVGHLKTALDRLQQEQVDQIVVIGDIFELGKKLDETCRLLADARAIGVWGNHDFGLCVSPTEESRTRYAADSLRFMTSLGPRLELDGCHFCHIEPWLDAGRLEDLWYYEGRPDQHQRLDRIFGATPERFIFVGHYHEWMLAQPDQIASWHGECPVQLTEGRYFVVVGALCEGDFATFDTQTCRLTPFHLS